MEREFRGVKFSVSVIRKSGDKGLAPNLIVDGNITNGNLIPVEYMKGKQSIRVILEL